MINTETYTLEGTFDKHQWVQLAEVDVPEFTRDMLKPPYFFHYRIVSNITNEVVAELLAVEIGKQQNVSKSK